MTQESLLTVRPVATGEGPTTASPATEQVTGESATALPVPKVEKPQNTQNVPDQQSRDSAAQKGQMENVRKAMERLQAKLDELRASGLLRKTKLEIELDEELGDKILVKIIDTETDEVVREVPPRELVEFAKRLSEAMGVILDTLV